MELKEDNEGRSPWSSVFDPEMQNMHSYIDFNRPSPVVKGEGNGQSPWLSQEFIERIPVDGSPENDQQMTFHQAELSPESSHTKHFSHCISLAEHQQLLRQQSLTSQLAWDRERLALLDSLNRQMREFQDQLTKEYKEKLENWEKKANSSDKGSEVTTKTLSDELLKRQFEDCLTDETEKNAMLEKEIGRMKVLLMKYEMENKGKCEEIDNLKAEIEKKDELIANLMPEKLKNETLTAKITALNSENLSLRRQSSSSNFEETLKIALQELENENSELKKDYEELLAAHQHALHTQNMEIIEEKPQFKASSPLKRKFTSLQVSLNATPKGENSEMREIRRRNEEKSMEYQAEIMKWKGKTQEMMQGYRQVVGELQSESKQLKADIASLSEQTRIQLQAISTLLRPGLNSL